MELLLLTAALVGLLVIWKRQARRRASHRDPGEHRSARRRESTATEPHAAVSIQPCEDACLAAWELEDQRFLIREAPRLPLPDCDAVACRCEFLPHKDRRAPGDRRSRMSTLDQDFAKQAFPERDKGRRRTDR